MNERDVHVIYSGEAAKKITPEEAIKFWQDAYQEPLKVVKKGESYLIISDHERDCRLCPDLSAGTI